MDDEMDVDQFKQEIEANIHIGRFKKNMTLWIDSPAEVIVSGLAKLIRALAVILRKNASEIRAGNPKTIQEVCSQIEQVLLCIPSGYMPTDVDDAYYKLLDALYTTRFPVTTILNHILVIGLRQSALSRYFSDILSPYDAAKLNYFLRHAHDYQSGFSLKGFRLSDFLLASCFMEECPPQALLNVLRYGCVHLVRKKRFDSNRCEVRSIGDTHLSENKLMSLLQFFCSSASYFAPMTNEEIQAVADRIKIIFRSIHTFSFQHIYALSNLSDFETFEEFRDDSLNFLNAIGRFPELEQRLGNAVIDLKHLCRCEIRKTLYQNWALPDGIKNLGVSLALEDYLDLKTD